MGKNTIAAKKLREKYSDTLKEMYKYHDVDSSVLWSMLIHEMKAHFKMEGKVSEYKGVPANFNWDELLEDYKKLG